jgi:hypothetical protein
VDLSSGNIGFACARLRRAPTSSSALMQEHAINRQLALIGAVARSERCKCVTLIADFSTTAGTRFVRRPAFLQAVERARSAAAILMIEDIGSIVRHLQWEAASEDVTALLELDVPVFEASTRQFLNRTPRRTLFARAAAAHAAVVLRASAIQRGVGAHRSHPGTAAASKRAASRRRAIALSNARRLAPLVREIAAEGREGDPLNANALARALNERGIRAPRGGEWGHGTAARLMKAVRSLAKQDES